jgi:hypothetical protein
LISKIKQLMASTLAVSRIEIMEATMSFWFVFSGIHIFNTRSAHTDTDFAAASLSIDGVSKGTKTIALGDLNNGDHGISNGADAGPWFGPFAIPAASTVEFSYSVVNHGADANQGQAAASAAANAVVAQADPNGTTTGDAIKAMVDALINILFANCDGVVAAGKMQWTGASLAQAFGAGSRRDFGPKTLGYNSPAGCGSNSDYNAHLIILKDQAPPVA